MSYLTLQDLESISDLPEKDIAVPQWGGKMLKARGMSKSRAIEYLKACRDTSVADADRLLNIQKALIKCSIVEPVMTDEIIDVMFQKSPDAIDHIVAELMDFHGYSKGAADESQRGFLSGDSGGGDDAADSGENGAVPGDGETSQNADGDNAGV